MVFTYGLISPSILMFGFLYFGFKYFIDKYNLTVVYPKEYEGRGDFSKNISYYQNFSILLVQILMLGLFTTTLQRSNFFWGIILFMIFQGMIIFTFKFLNVKSIKEWFRKRGNFMSEFDELEYDYNKGRLNNNE